MPPWYTGPDPLNLGEAGDVFDDTTDQVGGVVNDVNNQINSLLGGGGAWYSGPDPISGISNDVASGIQNMAENALNAGPDIDLGDFSPDGSNHTGENQNPGDGLGWWPTTGNLIPEGPVLPEDGPWFPGLDSAIGGAGDMVGGLGNYIGGGVNDIVTGGSETIGETVGGLFGGFGRESGAGDVFGGISNFMLMGMGMLMVAVIAMVMFL